jgi:hypothetical protein
MLILKLLDLVQDLAEAQLRGVLPDLDDDLLLHHAPLPEPGYKWYFLLDLTI